MLTNHQHQISVTKNKLKSIELYHSNNEQICCRHAADLFIGVFQAGWFTPLQKIGRSIKGFVTKLSGTLHVWEPLEPRPTTIYLQLIWRKHPFHDNTRCGLLLESPVMYGGGWVDGWGGRALLQDHIIPLLSLSQHSSRRCWAPGRLLWNSTFSKFPEIRQHAGVKNKGFLQ